MLIIAPLQSRVEMREEIVGKLPEGWIYDYNAKSAYASHGANIRDAPSDRDVRGEVKGVKPCYGYGGERMRISYKTRLKAGEYKTTRFSP